MTTDPIALAAVDTFDIAADLRPGTTLLEASAGTGKTWTIAALVTKHIASGDVRLDEMLVVTFTRAASQELRERVRRQLDEAVQLLAEPTRRDPANRLHDWLLTGDDAELARRHGLLTTALVSFDAATIATIHQFCQLVLRSLGVAGDTDASATLVEDLEQLTEETVDDLYLARFGHGRRRRGPGPRRSTWPGRSSATRGPGSSPPTCSPSRPTHQRRCGCGSPPRCSTRSSAASAGSAC